MKPWGELLPKGKIAQEATEARQQGEGPSPYFVSGDPLWHRAITGAGKEAQGPVDGTEPAGRSLDGNTGCSPGGSGGSLRGGSAEPAVDPP